MRCEIGERFGHWIILNKVGSRKHLCKCRNCGIEKQVNNSQLFSKSYDRFAEGTKCRNCLREILGNRYKTTRGFWYTVITYKNATDITIKFDPDSLCHDGYERRTSRYYITHGTIDYPFERSTAGVGYTGYIRDDKQKLDIHIRDVWSKMLQRCYKPSIKDKVAYQGCTVCEDWHSYVNFYTWYNKQMSSGMYEVGYQLDKDILKWGNKIYCPELCRLVPEKLNSFLNNFEDTRGTGTPNGVNWKEKNKKYQVSIKDENTKTKYLCITEDVLYGYKVYSKEKERIAKVLALRYAETVDKDIIDAFNSFKCPDWDIINKGYF